MLIGHHEALTSKDHEEVRSQIVPGHLWLWDSLEPLNLAMGMLSVAKPGCMLAIDLLNVDVAHHPLQTTVPNPKLRPGPNTP